MGLDITGIGAIADVAGKLVDKFFPDKTQQEKDAIMMSMQDMMNQYNLVKAQTDINLEEAKSPMWFIAGWRPFIGWICGAGLGYQFLFMPIMNGLVKATLILLGHSGTTVLFVGLDTATLTSCLSGLLGLGALRTFEKHQNVEDNRRSN
jgi:hypothetical protein